MTFMTGLFYTYAICAGAGLLASVLLALQGWENRRFVIANCRRQLKPFDPPFVAVIVPVKGMDPDLERSLEALVNQDYPEYEVHFVGENEQDPAYEVVRRLIDDDTRCNNVYWHSAGLATDTGQKVHNLEAALDCVSPEAELVEFADSDASPNASWLRNLTYRLAAFQGKQGASTGYRVCVPERPTISNFLLYTINAAVGGLAVRFGPFNMIWGGAWITRRELLPEIRSQWRETISDDVLASGVMKRMGWRVGIEPRILVPSTCDMSFGALMEFLRRQFFLVYHYSRGFWWGTAIVWTLMLGCFWGSTIVGVTAWANGWSWWRAPFVVAAIAYLVGSARAYMRQQASRAGLPDLQPKLRAAQRFELVAHPLASLVGWLGMISAAIGNSICWRGIFYRIGRDGKVIELRHPEPTDHDERSSGDMAEAKRDAA